VKRSETYKNSIEKAEGKLVSTYYTLGQYDGVSIVEAPDDAKSPFCRQFLFWP
jgi:uncharacterized protein with GYD domain